MYEFTISDHDDIEVQLFQPGTPIEHVIINLKNDFQRQIDLLRVELLTKISEKELQQALSRTVAQNLEFRQNDTSEDTDDDDNITSKAVIKKALHGSDNHPNGNDELEQDFFTLMMLSPLFSKVWVIGFLAFLFQIVLGILTLHDQIVKKSLFGTTFSIPVKTENNIRVAQVLVIILSAMTQTDLLIGLRNIFLLPYQEKDHWSKIIQSRDNKSLSMWICRILLPNFLKMSQGVLILFTTFLVIVQSDDVVDLLKDFSALFVISTIDDLFFLMADLGYFGRSFSEKAQIAKDVQIGENKNSPFLECHKFQRKIERQQLLGLISIIGFMLLAFVYITVGQENGRYFQQMFPNCKIDKTFEDSTFLSIVGDGICQFQKDQGLNVIECGWDGGDCEDLNERYPDCAVPEFSLLGNGKCDGNEYNSAKCGFDNGDCIEDNFKLKNQYPKCEATQPGLVGNGFCDGGLAHSVDCDWDGGDCKGCIVTDVHLIKNGFCNGGNYATEECSYDGGDCEHCTIDEIHKINDGFCDEGEYNTEGCSYDGGDCIPETLLVGKAYDGAFKWFSSALSNNGVIYSPPYNHNFVLKFDPTTDSTSLLGEDLGIDPRKFSHAVTGKDGYIYGIPYLAKYILRIDPETDTSSSILEGHPLLASDRKFGFGISVDSVIYFVPYNFNRVVKFDPSDIVNPLTEIGDDLGDDPEKWFAGAIANDGNIYCVPVGSMRVLKINPRDDTTSYIGARNPVAQYFYYSGTLARDGNIYACPYAGQRILQINVEDQSTNIIGPDFGEAAWCGGFVERDDGFMYGMPSLSSHVIRFDPVFQTATRIRMDESVTTLDEGGGFSNGGMRWGYPGILAGNDIIYSVPLSKNQILAVGPVFGRK